jgi:hypothetical protein
LKISTKNPKEVSQGFDDYLFNNFSAMDVPFSEILQEKRCSPVYRANGSRV